MSSSLSKAHIGIKHSGPVQHWQTMQCARPPNVLFYTENCSANYDQFRHAFERLFGPHTFTKMAVLHNKWAKDPMAINVIFADPERRRRAIAEGLLDTFVRFYICGENVHVKVISAMPHVPPYTVYKIANLPLLSGNDIYLEVWKAVTNLMEEIAFKKKWEKERVQGLLVDVVPEYTVEKNFYGTDKILLDGIAHVVVKRSTNLGTASYIFAFESCFRLTMQEHHYGVV